MAEENTSNVIKSQEGSEIDFVLFLILILLLMGNQNTFTTHFNKFNTEITHFNQIIQALSATAEGLQGAFSAPQKVKEDLNL